MGAEGSIHRVDALDDPRLADFHHLRDQSRRMGVERSQGIFVVEGHLSVAALLESTLRTRAILVSEAHAHRYVRSGVPVFALPSREIERLTGVHFHRGVLASADRPTLPTVTSLARSARLLLVLEAVNDHENVGALFRNAAAFGVDGVVLDPTAADPLYRRATRVSLGHVLRVPFARASAWPGALDELRDSGFAVVGLDPSAEEALAGLVADPPPRIALLVGAEGEGLSAAARAAVDRQVRIPMVPGVDSVNVATAAAVALAALYQGGSPAPPAD
ncbi:MAG: TrmH family RNA methyltransferase [Acidimicrobiales bacterium]